MVKFLELSHFRNTFNLKPTPLNRGRGQGVFLCLLSSFYSVCYIHTSSTLQRWSVAECTTHPSLTAVPTHTPHKQEPCCARRLQRHHLQGRCGGFNCEGRGELAHQVDIAKREGYPSFPLLQLRRTCTAVTREGRRRCAVSRSRGLGARLWTLKACALNRACPTSGNTRLQEVRTPPPAAMRVPIALLALHQKAA